MITSKIRRNCKTTFLIIVCIQLLAGLIILDKMNKKTKDGLTSNLFSSVRINQETKLFVTNIKAPDNERKERAVDEQDQEKVDEVPEKFQYQYDGEAFNEKVDAVKEANPIKETIVFVQKKSAIDKQQNQKEIDKNTKKAAENDKVSKTLEINENHSVGQENQRIAANSNGNQSNQDENFGELLDLHYRVWKHTSSKEVEAFYNRDRETEQLFKEPLDVYKDRKILQRLFPSPDENYDRVLPQMMVKLKNTTTKTILLYNPDPGAHKKFREDDCSIKDCILTFDKQLAGKADLVVFREMLPSSFQRSKVNKNQVTAISQLESAQNRFSLSHTPQINWTFTYRIDSVLNGPYERFTTYPKFKKLPTKAKRNFAAGKTKMVAWFVSNCGAANNRKNYAQELQKFVSVDIYGACGTMQCFRRNKECFEKLKTDYKFYLSFENSNCKDYVTEKLFWNGHLNEVLPIVMGAHPDEYKKIAPPRSYIHVDLFESPKELAEYLKFLDKHDEFYNSYFLWKDTGHFINTKSLCRLCSMAHLAPHFPMWYTDVNKWWSAYETCQLPHDSGLPYSSWRKKTSIKNNHRYIQYGYDREAT